MNTTSRMDHHVIIIDEFFDMDPLYLIAECLRQNPNGTKKFIGGRILIAPNLWIRILCIPNPAKDLCILVDSLKGKLTMMFHGKITVLFICSFKVRIQINYIALNIPSNSITYRQTVIGIFR